MTGKRREAGNPRESGERKAAARVRQAAGFRLSAHGSPAINAIMKNMKKLVSLGLVVTGNLMLAAAVAFLIVPNEILTGGVAGVSVALYPLLHIPTVAMINGLTIGLYILGAVMLGKKFAMNSLLSAILYPLFVSLFTWVAQTCFPPGYFIMESWVASIYSGFLCGLALGLVFRTGASTGGMDIPALILAKYTPIKEGEAVMLVDGLTVALGIASYGLQAALVGLISVFVSGYMINRTIMLGSQPSQNVMIITDQWEAVRRFVLEDLERGVTLLDSKGGYTETSRPVVMCVIARTQYPQLEQGVLAIDRNAFIIVSDVNSVHGEGFVAPHGTV